MSTSRVSEVVARPARGAGQSLVAAAIVEFIDAVGIYTFDDGRGYAASVVLLSLVLSGLQVLVENATGKGLLRRVPPTSVPVVDSSDVDGKHIRPEDNIASPIPGRHGFRGDPGAVSLGLIAVVVVIVLVVLLLAGRL